EGRVDRGALRRARRRRDAGRGARRVGQAEGGRDQAGHRGRHGVTAGDGVGGERRRRRPAVGVGGDRGAARGSAAGPAAGGGEGDADALDEGACGVANVRGQGGAEGGVDRGRLVVAGGGADGEGRVVVGDGAGGRGRGEGERRPVVQQ